MNDSLIELVRKNKPFCHFSVDDVWRIFNKKNGKEFKFLKSLYDDFGVITSLYVFSSPTVKKKNFLTKIPSKFWINCPWLKFGPHASDWNHPFNVLTIKEQKDEISSLYKEIRRIAGRDSFAENVRLHFFKGSREAVERLSRFGVKALFTQNFWHNRISYCLPPKSRENLNSQGFYFDKQTNLFFVKTSFYVEFRDDVKKDTEEYLKKYGFCVFNTHEECLTDPKVQKRIRRVLSICQKKGVPFVG